MSASSDRPLLAGRVIKADAATELIDGHGQGADQLRQGATQHALQHFQLKSAILAMAEAQAEMRVQLVLRLDVRNPPAIALDAHPAGQSGHRDGPARPRQTPAKKQTQ